MRKMGLCKVFIITMSILMILGFTVPLQAIDNTKNVTIYHTNDMHGSLARTNNCIGIDNVAALKDQTENAILVDAGDATQGLPLASLSQGADVIDIMNSAGYDVMAAGNHEFDYGTQQLLANANRATFPILAANVYNKATNNPVLQGTMNDNSNIGCHTIVEVDGVKVGFFGITTKETQTATNPSGIKDIEFKDEIETSKKEIDELEKAGADVVVAITHLGEYSNVPCTSSELAKSMSDEYQNKLDIIIDGHSHTIGENLEVNNVLIQQTGTGLVNLGKIELTLSNTNDITAVHGSILEYDDINVEPKASVSAKIDEITAIQNKTMLKPVCDLKNTLWGGYINNIAVARMTETNLGDFTTDAFVYAANQFIDNANNMERYQDIPILAVENGGGIRESLFKGTITLGDVVTVFPFSNTLMIKQITPKTLYEVLELSVSNITGQDKNTGQLLGEPSGGFLQVGGFSFTYNPASQNGSKVENIHVNNTAQSLDRNDDQTSLLLVSNNFIMSGGNGYRMLADEPLVGEIGGELETILDYISLNSANGTQPLSIVNNLNRIQLNGEYTKTQYEVVIKIIDSLSGEDAINRKVPVYIDGNDNPIYVKTDNQGMASIIVDNGEHSIYIPNEDGIEQVYVNNYIGIDNDNPISFTGSFPIFEESQEITEELVAESKIESQKVSSVATGDDVTVGLYFVMMMGSAVLIKNKYKQKETD